ncbi:MAG: phosphate/phosphite/phosphonate ABC transporter substrate-binding protein, partial [Quisquiliibacterium sp.]
VLVVLADGPIKTIQDLNGKKVAFPSPNALGASLLMRADLDRLHKISIVPVWSQTHSSSYLNVALGITQAAGGVRSTLAAQKPELRDRLKVIYQTRSMPPHPVVGHPRVPAADRERVRQAFLDMGLSSNGAALLAKVPMKKPIPASVQDYQVLGEWGLESFYVK